MTTPVSASRLRGIWFWLPALLWFATYFGARAILEMRDLATHWRVLAACVPVPMFVWALISFLQVIRGMDELERRIQLEALAVAFPLTLVLLMTLGLLEIALPLAKEDWSYRHVWAFCFTFYVLGIALAKRRYS